MASRLRRTFSDVFSWNNLIWEKIMGFTDLSTLMNVALVSKYHFEMLRTNGVWKRFVLTQLSVDIDLVPPEYEPMNVNDANSWKSLYKTVFKVKKFFTEDDKFFCVFEYEVVGGFWVANNNREQIVVAKSSSFVETSSSADALTFQNIRPGIWIVCKRLMGCNGCAHYKAIEENCIVGRQIELEAHQAEFFLSSDYGLYKAEKIDWKEKPISDEELSWKLQDFSNAFCGIFCPGVGIRLRKYGFSNGASVHHHFLRYKIISVYVSYDELRAENGELVGVKCTFTPKHTYFVK